jgi:type IV pilus assembly protein PilP
MKKNLITICNLACLIGLFSFMLSCDQPAQTAAGPKVIRKKIYAKADKKTKAPEPNSVSVSQPKPKVKPRSKPTDSKQKASEQRPLLAEKAEPSAGHNANQKPALKPKSDISIAEQPKPPKPAVKTDTSKKIVASTAPVVKKKPSMKLPPMYNPKGKIDPFLPLFSDKPTVAVVKTKKKKRIPRTPLEKIDLSQLKLVGIILASSGNKALVEEASGKGYVIKKGTFIGTNSGKVIKIEKQKVVVAEEYADGTIRNRELKLPKPPGEM